MGSSPSKSEDSSQKKTKNKEKSKKEKEDNIPSRLLPLLKQYRKQEAQKGKPTVIVTWLPEYEILSVQIKGDLQNEDAPMLGDLLKQIVSSSIVAETSPKIVSEVTFTIHQSNFQIEIDVQEVSFCYSQAIKKFIEFLSDMSEFHPLQRVPIVFLSSGAMWQATSLRTFPMLYGNFVKIVSGADRVRTPPLKEENQTDEDLMKKYPLPSTFQQPQNPSIAETAIGYYVVLFLDFKDAGKLRIVSKTLHCIVPANIYSIKFSEKHDAITKATSDQHLTALVVSFANITKLNLSMTKITDGGLHRICSVCTKIADLNIVGCQIRDKGLEALTKLSALQILDIRGCSSLTSNCQNVLKALIALHTLKTTHLDPQVVSKVPRVRHLKMISCFEDGDLGALAEQHNTPETSMVALDICRSYVTDFGFQKLLPVSPTLQYLELMDCKSIGDGTLTLLGEHCPRIMYLGFMRCDQITNAGLIGFAQKEHKSLKGLCLRECTKITDEGIVALVPKCPNLVALNLSAIDNLTDASTSAIVNHCHELIGLDLASNKMTSASISTIIQNKQNLKHLKQVGIRCETLAESEIEKMYQAMPQLDASYYGKFIITAGNKESGHYWFEDYE